MDVPCEDVYDPKSENCFQVWHFAGNKGCVAKYEMDVNVVPFVSEEVVYLSADAEDKFTIAQANAVLTENKEFSRERISCRYHSGFMFSNAESIDYMDVAPHQVVGISAALIPFLEHDDANRALMGSNMMAQAVPLVRPEIPLVSTGMEGHAALDSGQVVVAGGWRSCLGNRIKHHREREAKREPRLPASQISAIQSKHVYRSTPICCEGAVDQGWRYHRRLFLH